MELWKQQSYIEFTTNVSAIGNVFICKQYNCYTRLFAHRPGAEDFFIYNSLSKVMDSDNLSRHFAKLLKKLNFEHIKFHAMRHTFATRAIGSGVDVATVSGILGHSDVTTTTHCYVHPRYETMRIAMRGVVPVKAMVAVAGAA